MRSAQTNLQELETSRYSASAQALDASTQLEALREELYEVPLQSLVSGQPAEITELQVEAYLERYGTALCGVVRSAPGGREGGLPGAGPVCVCVCVVIQCAGSGAGHRCNSISFAMMVEFYIFSAHSHSTSCSPLGDSFFGGISRRFFLSFFVFPKGIELTG
jgi:hypothetical protein